MSASRVRMGLIGCGVIGRKQAEAMAAAEHIDLVAVADPMTERAAELASALGVEHVYGDGEALLSDAQVEAVVLAMPTGVRTAMALAALRHGKHVLLEKPVAMNVDEVDALIEARGERVVGVCSSRLALFDSAQVARAKVASGELGPLRVVRVRGLKAVGPKPAQPPPPWRLSHRLNGGGIMANWGCYDLNYIMEATAWQLQPRTAFAQTFPPADHLWPGRAAPDSDAEAHVVAMFRCANGAVLTMERGEFLSVASDMAWQITGDRGSLRLEMMPPTDGSPCVIHDDTDPEEGLVSHTLLEAPGENQLHAGPVRDFAFAILEGRTPKTGLKQARLVQQMTDAIYASARSGIVIELEESRATTPSEGV